LIEGVFGSGYELANALISGNIFSYTNYTIDILQNAPGVEISNNVFEFNDYPMNIKSSKNNILSNTIYLNTNATEGGSIGMSIGGSSNMIISNSIIWETSRTTVKGINMSGNNNIINGNIISNPGGYAIYAYSSTNSIISNNIIDNSNKGIYFDGIDGKTISIISNIIKDSTPAGINITNARGAVVLGNKIIGPATDGIYVYNVNDTTINNNYIDTATYNGLRLIKGFNSIITSNRIVNCEVGINCFDMNNSISTANILKGNTVAINCSAYNTSSWNFTSLNDITGTSYFSWDYDTERYLVVTSDVLSMWIDPFNLNISTNVEIDTPTFKVDSTLNRVGIGTATPQYPLDVVGNIFTSDNVTADFFHGIADQCIQVPDLYVNTTGDIMTGNLTINMNQGILLGGNYTYNNGTCVITMGKTSILEVC
jgi:hypothetical protein